MERRRKHNTMSRKLISAGGPSPFTGSGVKERVWYPFYDRQLFATATAQTLTYFNAPSTNDLASNFEGNAAFPAGQGFIAHGLRIVPDVTARLDDVINFLTNSVLTFTIENAKKYALAPTWLFPGGVGGVANQSNGAAVAAAPANDRTYGGNGIQSLNNVFRFKLPVALRPQQQFKIAITTPAAITLSASLLVYVVMEGVLERNLQ